MSKDKYQERFPGRKLKHSNMMLNQTRRRIRIKIRSQRHLALTRKPRKVAKEKSQQLKSTNN